MKHTEPKQFDQSEIRVGEISALRLVPDVIRALKTPAHMLRILEKIAQCGDRVRINAMGKKTHFLFHPQDIEEVFRRNSTRLEISSRQQKMITDQKGAPRPVITNMVGKPWQKERVRLTRAMTPAKGLHPSLKPGLEDEVHRLTDMWRLKSEANLGQEVSEFILRSSYKIMFDQDIDDEALKHLSHASFLFNKRQFRIAMTEGLVNIFLNNDPRFLRAVHQINRAAQDVRIKYLEKPSSDKHTILSILDDDSARGGLDEQIKMLIRAGQTSSSFVLFSAIWHLAANPQYQEALAASNENDEIVHQVINETMRLSPPAHLIPKDVQEDIELEDGYVFERGQTVTMSPHITHRSPLFFAYPNEFKPDVHFSQKAVSDRPDTSFIPFSVGPRKCPGRGIVVDMFSSTILSICKNFELAQKTGSPKEIATMTRSPSMDSIISIRPRKALV